MFEKWRDLLLADNAMTLAAAESLNELESFVSAASTQLSALSGYSLYEVTGEDAQTFLQGQFCNDITQVSPVRAQITGYCTPKGRLLALPTIVGFDGGYRMLVPTDIAEAFIKRLRMFVLNSKVAINALDDWAAVGITVAAAGNSDELTDAAGSLPEGVLSVASDQDSQLIRWYDEHSGTQARIRYLRLATIGSQYEFWTSCTNELKGSANAWRLGDISAGIPSITKGVLDTFVPQMMNLQLIDALSFTKGCYPGQEIVARMQYLGKLKRHMRVFKLTLEGQSFDIGSHLQPGATLSSGSDENAGIVVDAMPAEQNAALVLAVTKVSADAPPFMLSGVQLTACDMPYELPSSEVA